MPTVSNRGENFFESPIRKLVPYAQKAKEKGVHVYHLNIGQPDIPTPEAAMNAVRNNDIEVLEYSPSQGFASYREKLVDYYKEYDIAVSADDILVTTGASEAILFGMMSCLDHGDEVIVPEPFYANYLGFAQAAGIKVVAVTSKLDNNFALPPIEEFESKITSKTKAIMICNPSNPTGYNYTLDELTKLSAVVKQHDLFLFADEVYREFVYDDAKFHSVLTLEEIKNNVVVLDSISKRYSATGARIGMIVSKNKTIISTILKFAQSRLSPPTFAQVLAESLCDLPTSYFDKVREEYDERRKTLANSLSKIPEVKAHLPKGAFYTFVRLPIDDSDKFCEWLLKEFSYNNSTVMLSPGTGFYTTPGLGKNEVRMAYVLNSEELSKAMDCLEQALYTYPGSSLYNK